MQDKQDHALLAAAIIFFTIKSFKEELESQRRVPTVVYTRFSQHFERGRVKFKSGKALAGGDKTKNEKRCKKVEWND